MVHGQLKPVLKTLQVGPNSLFTLLKERARSDLKRLKNQLLAPSWRQGFSFFFLSSLARTIETFFLNMNASLFLIYPLVNCKYTFVLIMNMIVILHNNKYNYV